MRSKEQDARGSGAAKAVEVSVPRRLMTTTWPGGTSRAAAASTSNTVMSGARSEANATTSSFWK